MTVLCSTQLLLLQRQALGPYYVLFLEARMIRKLISLLIGRRDYRDRFVLVDKHFSNGGVSVIYAWADMTTDQANDRNRKLMRKGTEVYWQFAELE